MTRDAQGRKNDKPMLKHLIKHLKGTEDELETHILREGWPFLKSWKAEGKPSDGNLIVGATIVNEGIGKLVNDLERRKKTYKAGRPKKTRFVFVRQIASCYLRHLDKPKLYSGPFPDIVTIAFRAVGIAGPKEEDDHSRIIRRVLKKYPFIDSSDDF